jgi:thioredoxin reductase
MAQSAAPRIAVLGAGPVGLEAALYARALNLPVTVYERGRVAEYLQRWGHVKLFSPFGMNSTPLGRAAIRAENPKHELPGDNDFVTGRDHVAAYLEPLAMTGQLIECLKLEARVVQVGRTGLLKGEPRPSGRGWLNHPFRLLVRDAKGEERIEEADVVLDCTGTYGQPRWLGEGGIPAVGETAARAQVAGGLEDILGKDRPKYAGKTVLIVGGGYTAATHACLLADLAAAHAEQWTIWLARGPRSTPLPRHPNDPLRERDRLAVKANMLACRGEGNVEFHANASVESLLTHGPDKGFTVTARVAGASMTWNVDRVIASVGYSPDGTLYRELQVRECPVALGPAVDAGPPSPKTSEPNFYVLGAKAQGRNGQFLLRTGFEQVRDVFAAITGKADRNLYAAR